MSKPLEIKLVCAGCGLCPDELPGYVGAAREEEVSPDEYVWQEEGTLNRVTGKFLCDMCYINAGMPTSPTGWTVPEGW